MLLHSASSVTIMIFQICLPFFFLLVLTSAQVVTLDSVPELKDLRQCALKCYDAHDGALRDPGEGIASELSCKNPNAPDNSCFCRVDLQSSAVKYISTCVDMWCSTNELDASSATQVYKDYCTSAGFTAEPQSVAAQTTSGNSPPL
jgi:hypothetical protein